MKSALIVILRQFVAQQGLCCAPESLIHPVRTWGWQHVRSEEIGL